MLPVEQSAERATVALAGWRCVGCQRFWPDALPDAEAWARRHCARSFPCSCGARVGAPGARCASCAALEDRRTWGARRRVPWPGGPVYSERTDTFFSCPSHAEERAEELGCPLESMRLRVCVPSVVPTFSMRQFLTEAGAIASGELPRGADPSDIERLVNGWIQRHSDDYVWEVTDDALDLTDRSAWADEDELWDGEDEDDEEAREEEGEGQEGQEQGGL